MPTFGRSGWETSYQNEKKIDTTHQHLYIYICLITSVIHDGEHTHSLPVMFCIFLQNGTWGSLCSVLKSAFSLGEVCIWLIIPFATCSPLSSSFCSMTGLYSSDCDRPVFSFRIVFETGLYWISKFSLREACIQLLSLFPTDLYSAHHLLCNLPVFNFYTLFASYTYSFSSFCLWQSHVQVLILFASALYSLAYSVRERPVFSFSILFASGLYSTHHSVTDLFSASEFSS